MSNESETIRFILEKSTNLLNNLPINATIVTIVGGILTGNLQMFMFSVGSAINVLLNLLCKKVIGVTPIDTRPEGFNQELCQKEIMGTHMSPSIGLQFVGFLLTYMSSYMIYKKKANPTGIILLVIIIVLAIWAKGYASCNTAMEIVSSLTIGAVWGLIFSVVAIHMFKLQEKEKNILEESVESGGVDERSCSGANKDDYVCQAYKNGKPIGTPQEDTQINP